MAHVLFAVANATGVTATLISTASSADNSPIGLGVTHTGGSGDDWISLPDCSDSTFWNANHITVEATDGSWAVSFWADDQNNRQFYWSSTNVFSLANPVPASQNIDNSAILIQLQNGLPVVTWTQWS